MKAQSLGSQALDQDSADAEPQRITAGQHYRTLITPEGQQLFAQSDWMITGDATLVWFRGAPLLQGRQHPFWGCQQVGLLHQELSSGWQRAGSTGVRADHIDHHAIVLRAQYGFADLNGALISQQSCHHHASFGNKH